MMCSPTQELQDASTTASSSAGEARTGHLFPQYLMKLLNDEVAPQALWWLPDGKAFAICPNTIADQVLDKHFQKTKYSSFIRRLHNEGYRRQTRKYKKMEGVTLSDGTVVLSHAYFQRDHPELLESFYKKQQKNGGGDSTDNHSVTATTTAAAVAGTTNEIPQFQPPTALQLAKAEHKMMLNANAATATTDMDVRLMELLNHSSRTTSPIQQKTKQQQQEEQQKKLIELSDRTTSLLSGAPPPTSSLLLDTARLAAAGSTANAAFLTSATGSADPMDLGAGMASALYSNLSLSQGSLAATTQKTPASRSSTSSSFGDLSKNIAAFRQARLVEDITDSTLLRQLEQQKQLFVGGTGAGTLGAENLLSRSSSNESISQRLQQVQQQQQHKRTSVSSASSLLASSSTGPPPLSLPSSALGAATAATAAPVSALIDSQMRLQQLRWDRQMLLEEQQQAAAAQQQQQQHRFSAMDALRLRAAAAFPGNPSSSHQPQWPHFN